MKQSLLLLALPYMAGAQEMAGFRTDNYAGVNAAFYNPALLSTSPYRVDINLFGIDANITNRTANLSELSFDFGDSAVVDKYTGGNTPNTIGGAVGIHLPSFSLRINDKLSIAMLNRARFFSGIAEIDGLLLNSINSNVSDDVVSASLSGAANMRMSGNAYTEIGIGGSYVVYNEGPHRIAVGATLKYLGGVGSAYVQLNKIKGSVSADTGGNTYIQNASGSIAVGVAGLDILGDDLKFALNSSGIGADLGVTYEYRNEESESDFPYLFKAGAALTDIGGIKYQVGSNGFRYGYNMSIPAGTNFSLNQFDGLELKEVAQRLESYPAYFQKTGDLNNNSFRVALPHALQLSFDYHPISKVFIAANAQISTVNSADKPYNPISQSCYWLTPRFETRAFAAYLPISIASISGFNIGMGLRAGPLYIGSNSAIRFLMKNSKQADVYFGFRFGFKYNKKDE